MGCGGPETGACFDCRSGEWWVEVLGAVFEGDGFFVEGLEGCEEVVGCGHDWFLRWMGLESRELVVAVKDVVQERRMPDS